MQKQTVTIINKLGLHARAAAKLVAYASRFASHIEIKQGDKLANGKSIMGVMMLAAKKGSEIEISVEGEDEVDALNEIVGLINEKFGEAE